MIAMSFSFSDLNLRDVSVSSGGGLKPGDHICRVKDAEWVSTKSNGRAVKVTYESTERAGSIMQWINVYLPASPEGQRIGREQIKTLAVFGGHPDPDNLGMHGLASLKGLVIGLHIEASTYMKDGVRKNSSEIKYMFDAKSGEASSQPAGSAVEQNQLDDEIPF
jgi:hypothetical protein